VNKILIISLSVLSIGCAQTPVKKIELHNHIHLAEFQPDLYRTTNKLGYGVFCNKGKIISNEEASKIIAAQH